MLGPKLLPISLMSLSALAAMKVLAHTDQARPMRGLPAPQTTTRPRPSERVAMPPVPGAEAEPVTEAENVDPVVEAPHVPASTEAVATVATFVIDRGVPDPVPAALETTALGRKRFEYKWSASEGLGAPGFNAVSCATCHKDPVIGGAGGAEFNVIQANEALGYQPAKVPGDQLVHMRGMRAGLQQSLERALAQVDDHAARSGLSSEDARVAIERCGQLLRGRQTPSLLGLGLVDAIPESEIRSRADPDDLDGDGIRGIAVDVLVDGKFELGRFGWKASVPRLADFVCLALGGESGITAPDQGRGFGLVEDNDTAPDPEMTQPVFDELVSFVTDLAAPARGGAEVRQGEGLFTRTGCAACHVPTLRTADGQAVDLYSDLLVHELRERLQPVTLSALGLEPDEVPGFRTPPLWGARDTAPYMHDGNASTLRDAILAHGAESLAAREAFERLDETEQNELIAFLEDL